jgi:putative transposase
VAQRFSAAIGCWLLAALAAEVPMAAPRRGNTGSGTYFITACCYQKSRFFQSSRMAELFVDVLFQYKVKGSFLLHEFVLMPDHFHLLITPLQSLEKTLQLIKGGFSYRARKELGFVGETWEKSFYDRRVRDLEEYLACRSYIRMNPVRKGLVPAQEEYPYSSAYGFVLDEIPQRLKPFQYSA